MATRAVLADLAADYQGQTGTKLLLEAVGGVDAARRVLAGEAFDLVVLAADALDKLIDSGRVLAASRVDLVHSGVAIAVPAGADRPDIDSEAALREAVLAATRIVYSTGPSGTQLLMLFARWGLAEALSAKLVQAPAGVPVATLLARGEVSLGFQQLSELIHQRDIQLLGALPAAVQINTTFSAGCCSTSAQPQAVQALLDFLRSPAADAAKRRHGMTPA